MEKPPAPKPRLRPRILSSCHPVILSAPINPLPVCGADRIRFWGMSFHLAGKGQGGAGRARGLRFRLLFALIIPALSVSMQAGELHVSGPGMKFATHIPRRRGGAGVGPAIANGKPWLGKDRGPVEGLMIFATEPSGAIWLGSDERSH